MAEVRFGLREAFSTASRPVMPGSRLIGLAAERTLGPGEHRADDHGGDEHEQRRRSMIGAMSSLVPLPRPDRGEEERRQQR